MKFSEIPQFTRRAGYHVHIGWDYLERWIEREQRENNLDLNPEFQRGHVWNDKKRRNYVEFILRGGQSSRDIYFNCPGWMGDFRGPLVLVDGKQRIEAVRKFLSNKLSIFDGHHFNEFEDRVSIVRHNFIVNINDLNTHAEVLQWYLDLNSGGVVHSKKELDKVRAMLAKEQQ